MKTVYGKGVFNSLINNLPFEAHLPGYNFCGPGTKLQKRLKRGDRGINQLDEACKDHDIAYSQSKDLQHRHIADKILENKAWSRVKANDASLGEKTSAFLVTNLIKTKRKLGMGLLPKNTENKRKKKKTKCGFRQSVLKPLTKILKNGSFTNSISDLHDKRHIQEILKEAKAVVRKIGGRKNINIPRIIPLPKTGGILPLLPLILGGLSAAGALSGGAAGIYKAVNDGKMAKKKLEEAERHNRHMEAIALGKKGNGITLQRYKNGYGLFLKQFPKNYQ